MAGKWAEDTAPKAAGVKGRLVRASDDGYRDSISVYLDEIARNPLLTREGEVALAMRMDAARIAILREIFASGLCLNIIENWQRLVESGDLKIDSIFSLRDSVEPIDLPIGDEDDGSAPQAAPDDVAIFSDELRQLLREACALTASSRKKRALVTDMATRWVSARIDALRLEELLSPFIEFTKLIEGLGRRLASEALSEGIDRGAIIKAWMPSSPNKRDFNALRRQPRTNSIVNEIESHLADKHQTWVVYVKMRSSISSARQDLQVAKNEMTTANLRLVVSIAKPFADRGNRLLDLCQDGNLGLMRAVDKFDARRGYKFATYASWWIRQAVTRAASDHSRIIRVPTHTVEKSWHVRRVIDTFRQEKRRDPSPEEIAEICDIRVDAVRRILAMGRDTVSLDAPAGEESNTTIGELVEDKHTPRPDESTNVNELRNRIAEAMLLLSPREERIVRMRYGIGIAEPLTLEQCGDVFGVTRERVRQIEVKALHKLKHPSRSHRLRYLI